MNQGRKSPTERGPHEVLPDETTTMIEEATAMIGEVSKVLQTKRWEVRDEPFAGFRSPPGRF
jgi:hypothetical protein